MAALMILVVEDDDLIGRELTAALQSQGYLSEWATTAEAAMSMVAARTPDLVILDLGLPDLDGTEVCRRLRSAEPTLPIVIVTARHSEVDIVMGLDAGADDYITKPFQLPEFLARVRAHLRRPRGAEAAPLIEVGDVRVDTGARRAWRTEQELDLTAKEFDLLAFLVTEAGNALTRERIMSAVWDEHWFGSSKTLDMHLSTLRRKLGESPDDPSTSRITTLRGVGYRFERP